MKFLVLYILFLPGLVHADFNALSVTQQEYLKQKLPKEEKITILSIDTLSNLPIFQVSNFQEEEDVYIIKTMLFGEQLITKNGPIENEVILRTQVNSDPQEVGVYVAHDMNGDIIIRSDSYFSSGSEKMISGKDAAENLVIFLNWLDELKLASKINYIEFIHSHPRYDAKSKSSASIHPLGLEDITSAKGFSRDLGGFPFIITATVPNGYSYRAIVSGEKYWDFSLSKFVEENRPFFPKSFD